jgi:hypothetical protein
MDQHGQDTGVAGHEHHCQNSLPLTGAAIFRPLWLVDVRKHCLKAAGHSGRYVALSCVWGRCSREDSMETVK